MSQTRPRSDRRRLGALVGIMLAVAASVGMLAFQAMYRLSMQGREQALLDIALGQAALLDASAREDAPLDEAIAGRLRSQRLLDGLGRSGELVINRRHGDMVERLTLRGPASSGPRVERNTWKYERLGEPSRAALANRTGTAVARDYRGVEVLTAFTSVERLGLGVAAKIEMAEVRAPLLQSATQVALAAIFLIELAALAFIRLMNPVLWRLEESDSRLRGIIDSAAEGIVTIEDGRVSALNPAAARIFGRAEGELTAIPFAELFPEDTDALERWAEAGAPAGRHQLTGRRADGGRFPLELALSIVRVGEKRLFTGVVHDLTGQQAAEQALRAANEELERGVQERTRSLFRTNQLLRATGELQSMFLERQQQRSYGPMLDRLLTLAGASSGFVARWSGGDHSVTLAISAGPNGWTHAEIQAAVRAVAAANGVVTSPPAGCPQAPGYAAIPLVHGDAAVGIAGLRGDAAFDQPLLAYLEPYLRTCAHLLYESKRERAREHEQERQLAYRRDLNSILLNVQDVILRLDMRGTLLWVSPSIAAVAGYGGDELIGRSGAELCAQYADFYRFLSTLERGYGQVVNFEIRLKRKDGSLFWGSANAHYFGDSESGAAGIEGVIRDISSYKQAEQRVEALNRLYTVLSEVNKAIVRQRDSLALYESVCRILVEHGNFRMAWIGEVGGEGQSIVPVAGFGEPEQMRGPLRIDDPRNAGMPMVRAVREARAVIEDAAAADPFLAHSPDDSGHALGPIAAFPFFMDGRVGGTLNVYAKEAGFFTEEHAQLLLSLVADISYAIERLSVERKNAEMVEDLRRVSEKLTHHMENTPLAVIEYDDQFVVRHWNVAAEAMFGIPSQAALGSAGTIIIPLAQQAKARHSFKRLLGQKGGWASMHENATADGRSIVCEWYNTPLTDGDGNVTGVISVGHDITEIISSRNEIMALNASLEQRVEERTRELAVVNHELESFSYSVSHDLRAPLRSIDGFSDLLLRRYGAALDETGHDYLQRVRRASRRMSELIDALLELSRVTSCTLERSDVDVSALSGEIIDELRQSQPERRAEVMVQPGLKAHADERLFRVVLANLVGNAWKFTRQREVTHIAIGVEEREGETVFFVRDNGAGFDMRYAGKLFGAFQRLHGAAEFDGTGIGLATVQRVVNRHGGRIWADAAVDGGASFYFTLGSGGEADAGSQEQQNRAAV